MANLPSGIGSLASGPGSFSAGGGHYIPRVNVPPNGYHIPLPVFSDVMRAGSGASAAGPAAPGGPASGYGPLNVTDPLLQTFGTASPYNSMTVLGLMNQGVGPFVSPFAGSGLRVYPPALAGAGGPLAAGSTPSGALVGTPLPRSGGKGVMG